MRELGIKSVDDYLSMIGALDERVKVSIELKQKASENEEAKLLMTVPGVGYFSALAILAEIGDIYLGSAIPRSSAATLGSCHRCTNLA